MEPVTINLQVKTPAGSQSSTAIVRNEGDKIIVRSETPKLEISFSYVTLLEFLYGVEKEQRKVKVKQM